MILVFPERTRPTAAVFAEPVQDVMILVRDTTNRDGGTLTFTAQAWEAFTASIR
jgi:Domain of unknown function (DUF397)